LCCDSELYSDTRDIIKNCKTLDEIQNAILNFNNKQVHNHKLLIKNINYDISMISSSIDKEMNDENKSVLEINLAVAKRKLTSTQSSLETLLRTYNYLNKAIQKMNNNNSEDGGEDDNNCPICLDTIQCNNTANTQCGHKFCWECIHQACKIFSKCPTCKGPVNAQTVFLLKEKQTITNPESLSLANLVDNVKSTKIGNIIHFCKTQLNQNDKVILFSQWDELLHKVGNKLTEYGIDILYCNGTVYQKKRAIHEFANNKTSNIIMLSSRNAACGINLTTANKIILLEPVYGNIDYRKSIESQAIGRADRIGQNKPIQVFRFIIRDTIEEDIITNNIDDGRIQRMLIK
jgi:SNF2 family DNA or RNA helicase